MLLLSKFRCSDISRIRSLFRHSHWFRQITWVSGADARADTKLGHLIGSETLHDLESPPASAPASAPESIRSHLSCDKFSTSDWLRQIYLSALASAPENALPKSIDLTDLSIHHKSMTDLPIYHRSLTLGGDAGADVGADAGADAGADSRERILL